MATAAALGVVLAATIIGLIVNWPPDRTIEPPPSLVRPKTESAVVTGLAVVPCRVPGRENCSRVTVRITSGKDEDKRASFSLDDASVGVDVDLGDRIRVYENPLPDEAVVGRVRVDRYGFADFERRSPLLWLAAAFAALVLVTGRFQGLRALLGLGGSLLVIVFFVVPAILDGRPPASVALFGALAVMFVTIPLAHGLGVKTLPPAWAQRRASSSPWCWPASSPSSRTSRAWPQRRQSSCERRPASFRFRACSSLEW